MISIGVSACLLGQKVRYDGNDKRSKALVELESLFELRPLCPEVFIGLGVPRPPIQLVHVDERIKALGVDDRSIDVTYALEMLVAENKGMFSELSGFVLTEKSPSCGLNSTKLHDPQGRVVGLGYGLFAKALVAEFPTLPLVEASTLENAQCRQAFIERCLEFSKP